MAAGPAQWSSIDDLRKAFLADRQGRCTVVTLQVYDWALGRFRLRFATLPIVPKQVIEFVRREPLSSNSQRLLYGVLRAFYAWVRERGNRAVPVLPHVFFSRRRIGETRGRRQWQTEEGRRAKEAAGYDTTTKATPGQKANP